MTILYIWTIVAMTPGYREFSWRETGVYTSPKACHAAAASLNVTTTYRCIRKSTGEAA